MRNRLIAVATVWLAAAPLFAQDALRLDHRVPAPAVEIPDSVVPDEIVVVFDEATAALAEAAWRDESPFLGSQGLDNLAITFGVPVGGVRKQFPTADAARARLQGKPDLSGYYLVKFDVQRASLDQVIDAYSIEPGVLSVERIGIHPIYATPNDGFFGDQWHLTQSNDDDMDAPEAWDIETGDPSIVVAVLDTGVRYFHKDLGGSNASYSNPTAADGNMWINVAEDNGTTGVDDDGNGFVDDWVGWDWVTGVSGCWSGEDCSTADNDPRDFNGHGTHCAGNVGAINNNGYATASPTGGWENGSQDPSGNGAKVMGLRIGWSGNYFGQEVGFVNMAFAASALYYAADNGARVASCSWGSSNSGGLGAAIDYFIASGGLIFKAAGNSGNQSADYMCNRSDVYCVAATNQNDQKASFSNYGTWVDISAPGVAITSSYHVHSDPANDYVAALDGTSMATPLTAATAAAVWSHNPAWTAAQVWSQLQSSADDLDAENPSYVGLLGAGRVNLFNAVNTAPECDDNADCDDGDPCNGVETCAGGVCQPGAITDCNGNGVEDSCDIASGVSEDCQPNGIPDECEGGDPCATGATLLVAFTGTTNVPGVGNVENEDIAAYNTASGQWSLYFDGSDVGIGAFAMDGLAVLPGGELLVSLSAAGTVPGLIGGPNGESVDDSDIIMFTPTQLGSTTSGTWTFYFDGSDVGLTTNAEDIDALSIAPDGRLVISTLGNPSVSGLSGLADEDLIIFNATQLGSVTTGTFSYYFDGGDVGLSGSSEDVDAACILPDGDVLLSTEGSFSVSGLSGVDEDVFNFAPSSLGSNTSGSFSAYFIGAQAGLPSGSDVGAAEQVE